MLQDPIKEQELESKIINLRLQGMSEGQIAKQLKKEVEQLENLNVEKFWERIYFICRNINIQKDANLKIKDVTQLDEMILNLGQQGISYNDIKKQLENEGIIASSEFIISRYILMRKEKKLKAINGRKKEIYVDDRIFELRQSGLYYREIAQKLNDEGIKISRDRVRERCKKIYDTKNMKEPVIKRNKYDTKNMQQPNVKSNTVLDDRIYELRESGSTYRQIAQKLNDEGIKISYQRVAQRCERIYVTKNMQQPNVKLDNRIFELRQSGITYREIAQKLNSEGIKISCSVVKQKCKRIYATKNMQQPNVKRSIVLDKRIFELREQGLTYIQIAQKLNNEGIKISPQGVAYKYKKMCAKIKKINRNKVIDFSKMDEEKILHIFNNIQHRKKATREQIEKLAQNYGIDYAKLKERNEKILY